MIDITGTDLVALVKAVYELSRPQGRGFMEYTPEPLTDEEAQSLINEASATPVSLDYVNGRACKFTVWKDPDSGQLTIRDTWFDHTDSQLDELLARIGKA